MSGQLLIQAPHCALHYEVYCASDDRDRGSDGPEQGHSRPLRGIIGALPLRTLLASRLHTANTTSQEE